MNHSAESGRCSQAFRRLDLHVSHAGICSLTATGTVIPEWGRGACMLSRCMAGSTSRHFTHGCLKELGTQPRAGSLMDRVRLPDVKALQVCRQPCTQRGLYQLWSPTSTCAHPRVHRYLAVLRFSGKPSPLPCQPVYMLAGVFLPGVALPNPGWSKISRRCAVLQHSASVEGWYPWIGAPWRVSPLC